MRSRRCRFGLCSLLVAALVPCVAIAQCTDTGAASLLVDPSARSLGMASASGAVFWGGDANEWANPALLGYQRGIGVRYSKMQFLPDLVNDADFTSTRITMGAYGVGLSFAGLPDHLGGSTLDYGTYLGLDRNGQLVTLLNSWERLDTFAIGINAMELLEGILGSEGRVGTIAAWGDLSLGWSRKTVKVHFVPPLSPVLDANEDRAWTNDLGLVARVRPLDTIDRDGPGPRWESLGGMTLDVAFAASSQNHADADIDQVFTGTPLPIARQARYGLGAHLASGLPPAWRNQFESANLGWLADGFAPLLSLGFAWDHLQPSYLQTGNGRVDCFSEDRYGLELGLANVVTLRWGYVDSSYFPGNSWGLGLGFSLGDIAGIRYDHATTPQGEGVSRRRDQGVMVFFDGVALADRLHSP